VNCVAEWKTQQHLEDHFEWHRRALRTSSIDEYDESAQETIRLGTPFTHIDRQTRERHVGYYHRDSSRFTGTDQSGFIVTHFQTDEGYVADLPRSTYRD
jgi:hypothetical protein